MAAESKKVLPFHGCVADRSGRYLFEFVIKKGCFEAALFDLETREKLGGAEKYHRLPEEFPYGAFLGKNGTLRFEKTGENAALFCSFADCFRHALFEASFSFFLPDAQKNHLNDPVFTGSVSGKVCTGGREVVFEKSNAFFFFEPAFQNGVSEFCIGSGEQNGLPFGFAFFGKAQKSVVFCDGSAHFSGPSRFEFPKDFLQPWHFFCGEADFAGSFQPDFNNRVDRFGRHGDCFFGRSGGTYRLFEGETKNFNDVFTLFGKLNQK